MASITFTKGYLTQIAPEGATDGSRTVRLGYNAKGLLDTVITPSQATHVEYDDRGVVLSATGPTVMTFMMAYEKPKATIRTATHVCQVASTSFTGGRLTNRKDANGTGIDYAWTDKGHLDKMFQAGKPTGYRYVYDLDKPMAPIHQIFETDRSGMERVLTTYTNNDSGLTTKIETTGNTTPTVMTWDGYFMTSKTGASGTMVVNYVPDGTRRVQKLTNPNRSNRVEKGYEYHPTMPWLITAKVDAYGRRWAYGYDDRANLVSVTAPDKRNVAMTFSPKGEERSLTIDGVTATVDERWPNGTPKLFSDSMGKRMKIEQNTATGEVASVTLSNAATGADDRDSVTPDDLDRPTNDARVRNGGKLVSGTANTYALGKFVPGPLGVPTVDAPKPVYDALPDTCTKKVVPKPCFSTSLQKEAYCPFTDMCQPACLCTDPDPSSNGCNGWLDEWSCKGTQVNPFGKCF